MGNQHPYVDPLFGQQLRALRQQRHLTLRGLAAIVHYSHTHIWELETARERVTPAAAALLDDALDANGTLAALAIDTAAQPPDGGNDMLRRTLLFGTPVLAAGALLIAATGDTTGTRTGRLDPATLTGLAAVAAQYRAAYQALPASALLPATIAHLQLVMASRPEHHHGKDRVDLLTTAGEMAALAAALLCLDAKQRAAAAPYLDLAWKLARAAGDIELQAVVLCGRSFLISYHAGDHRSGLEYADLARSVAADGATTQTRAWVAAVASERAATVGDLPGCRNRLDESRAVLAGDDDGGVWRGIGGFDAGKLRAYEGGNMVRLGRFDDARSVLDDALAGLDATTPRHRATALVDRAEAHLGAGDVDAACDDAGEALQLVVAVQHVGNLDRIGAVATRGAVVGARSAAVLRRDVQLARADQGLPI